MSTSQPLTQEEIGALQAGDLVRVHWEESGGIEPEPYTVEVFGSARLAMREIFGSRYVIGALNNSEWRRGSKPKEVYRA